MIFSMVVLVTCVHVPPLFFPIQWARLNFQEKESIEPYPLWPCCFPMPRALSLVLEACHFLEGPLRLGEPAPAWACRSARVAVGRVQAASGPDEAPPVRHSPVVSASRLCAVCCNGSP